MMPKTLVEFRAQNLRLLEQLCPDDPAYIKAWLKQFDEQNGILAELHAKPGKTRGASARKAASSGGTRSSRASVHSVS
jgi:hypothetical protein